MRLDEGKLAAIFVAFSFCIFTLYSCITPLFEASDELWHYPVIEHLAQGGGLPLQTGSQNDEEAPWRQEGSQPPLYYALAAMLTAPIDQSNWRELRQLNIHADMGVPQRDGNANAVLHTAQERFPWYGATLAVHIARLLSAAMSTITVLFVYLTSRELFGRDPARVWLRLLSMAFAACVPMFAFISGAINNDNAAVMFSTIGFWLALRLAQRCRLSLKHALLGGIIAGLGALSKSSALGLLGLFALAALFVVGMHRVGQGGLKRKLVMIIPWLLALVVSCLFICAWWFARNQMLYGDVLGWNGFLEAVGRRSPPATLAQLWSEREGFIWSYWGVFGTMNVLFPPTIYAVLNGIMIVAVVGCTVGVLRNPKLLARYATWLCVVWITVIFVALIRWSTLTPASQGRLMYPAIAPLACGMAYGLWRLHHVGLYVGAASLTALTLWVPFGVIAPAYAIRPMSTGSLGPAATNFGGILEFTPIQDTYVFRCGGFVEGAAKLNITLGWRVLQSPEKNYSIFVHAVDKNGVIVAQRDMYPGQGNLATRGLPINYGWQDDWALRIPALHMQRGDLTLRAGIYDAATNERQKTAAGVEWYDFGVARIAPAFRCPQPMLRYAPGFALREYSLPDETFTPGQNVPVTMTFVAESAMVRGYNVSLQLIDNAARKVAQRDVGVPTQNWKLGESQTLRLDMDVAKDAPAGVYKLLLVWYVPEDTFAKAAAYDAAGQYAGDQIVLSRLRIK